MAFAEVRVIEYSLFFSSTNATGRYFAVSIFAVGIFMISVWINAVVALSYNLTAKPSPGSGVFTRKASIFPLTVGVKLNPYSLSFTINIASS